MIPNYRPNPTDAQQDVLETAESELGILTFEEDKTRVIARGLGAAEKVNFKAGSRHSNAGVIMPVSDQPGKFLENQVGKP